jgi:serine/threonine protein kinase/tetratricopeptide (TPR) repeat protein
LIGTTLSHYEITAKLGEGGMGEVWRATDTSLNREVAVKVLPEEMAADPDRLERFKREAQAIAALNHPNIVTIYSVEEADGVNLLTMELIEGKSLDHLLPAGGLELDRLFPLAIQISDALAAAHEKGIVHRDLKPANVMVTGDGRVKVLDFGLAKLAEQDEAVGEDTQLMTQAGMVLGTVPYMSPEQVQAKPVDHRSDIFSLGILLYEMATGERPFRGDHPASVISAVLKDQPPLVTEVKADLPNHLGRIVRRCLEKDPALRYQSAKNLHHELETLHDEVKSGRSTVRQALPSEQSARPAPRAGADRGPVLKKLGLAIGAAAILAIAGFWALRSPSGERPAPTSSAAASHPIAVIGFENLSDPDDSQQLGRMLTSLITTDLAESGGLEVASSAKVLASLKTATGGSGRFDTALAAEAAKLAGAEVMLAGQLMSDDERLLLTAELVNVATGNTLGSIRQDAADRSELFELAGAIAGEVREQLGVAGGGSGEAIDLARALTDSAEAYRLYTTGEQALHERRFEDAVHDFGLAVKEDPSFALARYKQSLAAWWGGGDLDRREILEDGLPAIERLPDRWQKLYRAYLHVEKGETDEAWALLNEVLASSDALPDAYNLRGELRFHYTRYWDHRAMRSDLERALDLDPSFKLVFYHLLDSHTYLSDLAAAERLIARYRREDPNDRVIVFGETRIAAARRDFGEAVRLGREELRRGGDPTWEVYLACLDRAGLDHESHAAHGWFIETSTGGYQKGRAVFSRGTSNLWNGRFEQARADYDESTRIITQTGQPVTAHHAAGSLSAHALALSIVEKRAEAIDLARQAITIDPWYPAAHYLLGRFLFEAGRRADGERALVAFEEMENESYSPYPADWLTLLRADRALALGDSSTALSQLDRIEGADGDPLIRSFRRVSEGAAREASGDLEAALVAYRKAADPPEPFWPAPFSLEIPALYHVARLEEALSNHDGAREYYQRYLDRWGEADLPIPEVLQAKARLAAL